MGYSFIRHQLYKTLIFLSLFSLVGCGYRFGRGELLSSYSSLYIPYAAGDRDGFFTQALIHEMTTAGRTVYLNRGAELCLEITLLAPQNNTIGFAYAPGVSEDDGDTDIVVSNEARITLGANVMLIESRTGAPILGPLLVEAFIDYDFSPDLTNVNFHAFSLGQLEMQPQAFDAALHSLYSLLASKIVSIVSNAW